MRLLPFLTSVLLPFTVLAAKKDATVDRFTAALSKSAPQKLTDKSYDALTKAPRDYSVAVLLTAMGAQFGCQLCQEFAPEWKLLAESWTKGDKNKESRLLFGTLDFMDGKGTFQSVRYPEKSKEWKIEDICADDDEHSSNSKQPQSSSSSTQPSAPTQRTTNQWSA